MSLIDFLKGRKNIIHQKSQGLNLVACLINQHKDRKFTFKGFKRKYSGINGEQLQELLEQEVNNTLIVYRYQTKVKEYNDRKGISHMEITVIGKAGMMSRYNMLDVKLHIKTEVPEQ